MSEGWIGIGPAGEVDIPSVATSLRIVLRDPDQSIDEASWVTPCAGAVEIIDYDIAQRRWFMRFRRADTGQVQIIYAKRREVES